jgi:hypothetical protein
MRSLADNVAVGDAGREKGQRLSIFGGNVIATRVMIAQHSRLNLASTL